MRPTLAALPLAAALALAAGAAAPPAAPPAPPPGAAHDLVWLHSSRPYRVRLHLVAGGRPFQAAWRATADHLFDFLDADGDGKLSRAEAAQAPSVDQWRQLLRGGEVDPDAAPPFEQLAGAGKAFVTRDALRAYYRASRAGPLQVEWAPRPAGGDPLTDALFRHLDADGDGKLSRQELLAAPAVLNKLDADADEMVTPAELGAAASPAPAFVPGRTSGPAASLPFFLLAPEDDPGPLVEALLARYDRKRGRAELRGWVAGRPDLELLVTLGPGAPRKAQVLRCRAGAALAGRSGTLVRLDGSELEVGVAPGAPAPARKQDRGRALAMFRAADRNGDGFLEDSEVSFPNVTLVALMRLADRNGDGKVARAEYEAFLDLREKLEGATTFLALEDRGRRLFEALDADGDGRLSQREMRNAWARLSAWGRDGVIGREQVPQQYRLRLSHGRPLRSARASFRPRVELPPPPPPRRGPLWFRKMDRNRDGDVSRAEFLGTEEQFRRIDADGDGLIDADEAERADAWFRKQKK
jgi:Ca2+-binding EF-hand superfamily protein